MFISVSVCHRSSALFYGDDCLGVDWLRWRGGSLSEASKYQLVVFPTIRRLYTDFLTRPSACLCQCLIQFRGGVEGSNWFNWPIDCIDSIDRLIVLIWIVPYRRSLAVHSNGGRLGCLPRRPWFHLMMGRYWGSSLIRLIDWLNRSWCSLAGCSNGHRLVLVTVVWLW